MKKYLHLIFIAVISFVFASYFGSLAMAIKTQEIGKILPVVFVGLGGVIGASLMFAHHALQKMKS
jgi:hypothetical protein